MNTVMELNTQKYEYGSRERVHDNFALLKYPLDTAMLRCIFHTAQMQ